jgi:aminoglycoside 6-adenylyltransferase
LGRGYRLLVDQVGLDERLRNLAEQGSAPGPPTQADFEQLTADFWYHALWVAKKLRRGEVYTAIGASTGT